MRGSHLISAALFLAALGAAGPLRRDVAHKYPVRDNSAPDPIAIIPVSDNTDATTVSTTSSSTTVPTTTANSIPSIISNTVTRSHTTSALATASLPTQVPPHVSVRSTSYKNSTTTARTVTTEVEANTALPLTEKGSTAPTLPGTQIASPTTTTSVTSATAIKSTKSSVSQKTNTLIQTFQFSNTSSTRLITESTKTAGPLTPRTTTSSAPVVAKTNPTAPLFTVNNTSSIPIPVDTATSASAFAISTSTNIKTASTDITVASAVTTTIEPSITITKVPSVLPATLQTATSISPAQYTANLDEAQSYNTFFSTLNFSSPCTPGNIACLSGNMATCNQAGSFVISVCATGSECFAMPMNTTVGVVVECTDNALASSVLGLVATATTSTSVTGGIVTIPATTLVLTNPGVVTTTATSSSSALTFVTITFTEPTIPETTTTDFVTVTKGEPNPTNSIALAPPVPQVTSPPDPQTTSTFNGIAIIPVTDQNVSIEKETVTISVTVTKTIKVPEASIV